MRRLTFLHTDPWQADSFHGLPLRNSGGSNRSPGPAIRSSQHRHPASSMGADVAIRPIPAEMGRQGCWLHPALSLKFFYGQAVDHEPQDKKDGVNEKEGVNPIGKG